MEVDRREEANNSLFHSAQSLVATAPQKSAKRKKNRAR